jgi:hypothetical protein
MMSKKGNAELLIFLAVAITALGGVIFFLLPDNSASGQAYRGPIEQRPGYLRMSMLECQSYCFGRPTQTPRYQYPEMPGGQDLQECLYQCQVDNGIAPEMYQRRAVNVPGMSTGGIPPDDEGSPITGNFVLPAAKEYGGGISGVSIPGSKAFPGGRAIELPDQSCYTCSCMEQGITSATREAAEKVCADNCGGDIVSIVVGQC